ncbi:MAG: DUF2508 domain-containing protein [Epulopiscium sp. Nuni2H_MBin003]|nr:MAG: DUF2508 domain-containing protein [Epulopiscium sp. Nuni2H_MBin003]
MLTKKCKKALKKKHEEDILSREVEKVQDELAATLHNFENTIEPELLDYYTYAYKANQIKHSYLLKKLKEVYYSE